MVSIATDNRSTAANEQSAQLTCFLALAKILQGSGDTQTVLGGLTIHQPVAIFL